VTYSPEVETRSLYIHWPFCQRKCDFCPFVSFVSHESHMERYNNALLLEIERFAQARRQKCDIETLFIGGGTPSLWPDRQILDTFGKLSNILPLSKFAEVTIEVNPGTVREEQLDIWRTIGINRLSVGVQSLNDQVLKNVNRFQTAEDVLCLLQSAQRYFESISIDIILGLPGVSEDEWKDLLRVVVGWPIQHISIYFLTIHQKTPIYQRIKSGEICMMQDDDLVDQYNWSVDFLDTHGFGRYEISNFAKKGCECKHNKVYWERVPYKGFGVAACSFDGKQRFGNRANLFDYIERVERDEPVEDFCEMLTEDQVRLEKLMLGLRTDVGISREQLLEGLPKSQQKRVARKIGELIDKNFIYERDGRFVINPYFLTIENEIVLELLT